MKLFSSSKHKFRTHSDKNESSIDYVFLLMFHATNNPNIYGGVMRGLTNDSVCDLNLDEELSMFEVFVNYETCTC